MNAAVATVEIANPSRTCDLRFGLSSCRLRPHGRSGLGRSYRERALHWIPVRRRDPARFVVLTDAFTRFR